MRNNFLIAYLCLNYMGLSPLLFADETSLSLEQIKQRIELLDRKLSKLSQEANPTGERPLPANMDPSGPKPTHPDLYQGPLAAPSPPLEDFSNTVNDNEGIPKVGKANARIENYPASVPPANSRTAPNLDTKDITQRSKRIIEKLKGSRGVSTFSKESFPSASHSSINSSQSKQSSPKESVPSASHSPINPSQSKQSSPKESFPSASHSSINSSQSKQTSSKESVSSASHSSKKSRQSSQGKIGSYYVGLDYLRAWNNEYDVTHNGLNVFGRIANSPHLDFTFAVGLAWSDTEGGPNKIYMDGYGRSFYFPKHNRWSMGADIGLTLHKQFDLQNSVVNSIDPFIGLGVPLDYYFETEYDVMSYVRYGLGYSIGAEFVVFDSFSIIPAYHIGNFWYSDETENDYDKVESTSIGIEFCYFMANGKRVSLRFSQARETDWKGLTFSFFGDF